MSSILHHDRFWQTPSEAKGENPAKVKPLPALNSRCKKHFITLSFGLSPILKTVMCHEQDPLAIIGILGIFFPVGTPLVHNHVACAASRDMV